MRVMVTGASGLLGMEIADLFERKGHEVFRLNGHKQLDLREQEPVLRFAEEVKPDVIVHTAAIKDVDDAEKDPDGTYLTNTVATRNVAMAANNCGAKMVYISTDAVFDGEKDSPYLESDPTGPINVYGACKLAGEERVREVCEKHFIVRTGLLFGLKGRTQTNYALNLLNKWRKGETVPGAVNQACSNTYTLDLARAVEIMANTENYGTYHICNRGQASRYEFYSRLCTLAGYPSELVEPAQAAAIRVARRHKNTAMSCALYEKTFNDEMSDWQQATARFIQEYKKEYLHEED
ncbi:MAG: dTDP-4-dehydrorhamnose reductase [Erysipelotrichaceae bacterium]|nr:dTDP-4-dehydrorhamnose reductase [Erysipelotrichaceae bacterium]